MKIANFVPGNFLFCSFLSFFNHLCSRETESNDGGNVVEVDNDDVEVDPQLVGGDNVQVRIIQDEEDEDGDELYSPPPKKRRRFRK